MKLLGLVALVATVSFIAGVLIGPWMLNTIDGFIFTRNFIQNPENPTVFCSSLKAKPCGQWCIAKDRVCKL